MPRVRLRFPNGDGEARRAGYVVMLLGIIVLAGVLYQFQAAMNEVAYWDLRIAGMNRRIEGLSPSQDRVAPVRAAVRTPVSGPIKQEVRKANLVMSEIDLPWEALFDSVEHATNRDVALLSFQPDTASRTMRIGGEAKDIPAMLDFVEALEREPVLQDAHLLKYEVKRDDPHRPVIFLLTATWT